MLARALKIDNFNGRLGETYDFIALGNLPVKRLLCVGLGKKADMNELAAQAVGAYAANALLTSGETAVAFAVDDLPPAPVGFGAKIASYRFTKHKTIFKKPVTVKEFYILSEQAQAAQNQYEPYFAVARVFTPRAIWSTNRQTSLRRSLLPNGRKNCKNTACRQKYTTRTSCAPKG